MNFSIRRLIILASALVVLVSKPTCAARKFECEVCIKFLNDFINTVQDKSSPAVVESALKTACEAARGKDSRLCYYVGGLPTSATSIISEISKPITWGMPAEKICEKLSKKDYQICELKYDKEIDWKTINLNKLRVKELKKILMDWDEECRGCTEKSEFIKLIEQLKPKYVKEEL